MPFIQTKTRRGVDRNSVSVQTKAERSAQFTDWLAQTPRAATLRLTSPGIYHTALTPEVSLSVYPTTFKTSLDYGKPTPVVITCFETFTELTKAIMALFEFVDSGLDINLENQNAI